MDKSVSVRFYRITASAQTQGVPFIQRLREVHALREEERVRQISDIEFWMDKLSVNNTVAKGRLCRTQTSHLPPQALAGGKLTPLGVPAIGHDTVWQYEAYLSVMAIESSRNGVGLQKMLSFIRSACDCRGYGHFPVLDDEALEVARHGRIRELAVRVATPRNLETVATDQRQIKDGLVELMGSQIATQVEIRFSVTAKDPDIQPGPFLRAVNWLRGERRADRGNISKLQARIVEDDGTANTLDLLDAHLGTRRDLDLPDDDPDTSATIRLANISQIFDTHRAALERQFASPP